MNSDVAGAMIFTASFVAVIESFFFIARIWHERPMVGRDPNTGRYRSVRLMAAERRRS